MVVCVCVCVFVCVSVCVCVCVCACAERLRMMMSALCSDGVFLDGDFHISFPLKWAGTQLAVGAGVDHPRAASGPHLAHDLPATI